MTNDFIRDYRKIINDYTGNSGIYYFINNENPNLSYIGSSNNLGRRLEEYWRVMRGVKKANNPFTKFLNKNSNWSVVILDLCHPSELRLYEQLAIYLFNPSLNISFNIYPISQHKTYDFSKAFKLVNELLAQFTEGHYMYSRFLDMRSDIIKAKSVLDLTNESGVSTFSTKGGKPIIVYEFSKGNIINYFSSINIAMKVLGVKYQT